MKKTLLGLALSFLFLLHPAIRAGSVPQSGEPCQRMADSGSFLWNDSLSLSLVELHRASLPERTDSVLMADLQQADRSIRQTSAAQDTLGLAWAYTRKGDAEYRRNMYKSSTANRPLFMSQRKISLFLIWHAQGNHHVHFWPFCIHEKIVMYHWGGVSEWVTRRWIICIPSNTP